ncbi:SagB/ThcOx family dehydrogenase [Desulfothermus naphthae]
MPELKNSLGWQYIQKTKFRRDKIHSLKKSRISPAGVFKSYPNSKIYILPTHRRLNVDLLSIINKRRSWREFKDQVIPLKELSTILWAGYGVREKRGKFYYRNVPSAGALYPIEIYIVSFNVQGLDKGIYHYFPKDHVLELIKKGDFSNKLIYACARQDFVAKGSFTVIMSAIFRRNMAKYGHRGLRYILLDAGHIAQNMIIAGEAMTLGSCPVGAFFDDEVNQLVGLDGEEESVIYMVVFGKKV